MNVKKITVFVMVLMVLSMTAPRTVDAGLLDTIKGFFGRASDTVKGWFSGGGEKEFVAMLDQVEQSQVAVAEHQNGILETYSRLGQEGVDPNDPSIRAALDDLSAVTSTNEDLYHQLLMVRQELVDNDKDVSQYAEQLNRVQETQRQLEEGYQAIQNFNYETGAFTPPSQIAAGVGGDIWDDPAAQGYIDEWLAGSGLDEYGRFLGVAGMSATAVPDLDGVSRHQWVWGHLADERGGSGMTLRQYVEARLKGQAPALTPMTPPVAAAQPPVTPPVSSASSGAAGLEPRPSVSSVSGGEDLASVEASLRAALNSYTELVSDNKVDEAREVYEKIQILQAHRDALISQGTSSR